MQKISSYKLTRVLILVALLAGIPLSVNAFSSQENTNTATGIIITPEADSYVRSTKPKNNFGSRLSLYVDRSSEKDAFLRFAVNGYNSNITRVIFRIYANSSNSTGFIISEVTENNWKEDAITFNNAPQIGAEINRSGKINSRQWIDVDVSSAITGDGIYSFALTTTSSTNTNYASRENGDHAPRLVLSYDSSNTATPIPPSPTFTATNELVLTDTPTSEPPTPSLGFVPSDTPIFDAQTADTPTIVMQSTDTPTITPQASDTPTLASTFTQTSTPLPPTRTPLPTVVPTSSADPVLVGAGDIASCSSSGDEATANLIKSIPGTVFTAGDNVYDSGTAAQFTDCYDPSWGQFKNRTRPSPGNHDYNTSSASGYYGYFGSAAGDPSEGYYSYDLGSWHIIVLNSEISVSSGSTQVKWLLQDLANNPAYCTLAIWHEPRFSSGSSHGSDPDMQTLWQTLYDYHADVVVNGHEHNYERFAPQTPSGAANPNGLVEFVAGMGGRSHYGFGTILSNSVARNSDTYGVLKLTLHDKSYSWEFVPQSGKSYSDSGSAACVP